MNMKEKKGIAVFTDIEGTLCFGQSHGLSRADAEVESCVDERGGDLDDFAMVNVPGYEGERRVHNLSEQFGKSIYEIYMDPDTRRLFGELSESAQIYIVTGARKGTIEKRRNHFDFADGYVIENGGLILDADLNEDEGWNEELREQLFLLKSLEYILSRDGLVLDVRGRSAMIRLRKDQNAVFCDEEFEALYEELKLVVPGELLLTRNLGHIDILPAKAGKEGAVQYLIEKLGVKRSMGIGDDTNDIGFLSVVDNAFVMGNAIPEVIDVFKDSESDYVSREKYFEGINEILREIRARLAGM